MLICLNRENVAGARNSIYEDTDGYKPVIKPQVLAEGNVLYWKDNEIYHYVEPAALEDKSKMGTRTVMIAHYPAMQYITGETNPNNTLAPSGKHPPTAYGKASASSLSNTLLSFLYSSIGMGVALFIISRLV